jgi:non-ribosomal peptide synthetase component F
MPGSVLKKLLNDYSINVVTLPPSALAAMPRGGLQFLETIVVAGEACPPGLAAAWSVNRRFLNAYGPTEATVCATIAECKEISRRTPIGVPIANTKVYILDSDLKPVPVGVPGEAHISGVGLARG